MTYVIVSWVKRLKRIGDRNRQRDRMSGRPEQFDTNMRRAGVMMVTSGKQEVVLMQI